jgi:outer membrane receptor protein involved in Fe transport
MGFFCSFHPTIKLLRMIKTTFFCLIFLFSYSYGFAQNLTGTVTDAGGEPVIGANLVIKGTGIGTTTDFDGNFSLDTKGQKLPFTLEVSFIGYATKTIEISKLEKITVALAEDQEMLSEVSIIEQRLSEKQKKSALTVEALDALAIKETPAANFYEALGNLKGVDLTSASIGFKIINTRGFNSTSPVRSLQIIDGVDNQAPGLNFSLGNFLGASELDIANVDIIAGASTAFYGPGAFNGVISMTTKDPFLYQGISASVKVGERALTETAVRYAEAFKIGDVDYENFAFKLNLFYLRANDWEATNYNPVDDSEVPADNPGGYDAVNIYGDENLAGGNNYDNLAAVTDFPSRAGLGIFYRTGYREEDLVNYNTRNFKGGLGLHYKLNKSLQLNYNFNYGTGTTVYQGENRFSLSGIQFYQNTLELKKEGDFFVRAYSTNEDAGDSYDAVLTAFKMNEAIGSNADWNTTYAGYYTNELINNQRVRYGDSTLALTGSPFNSPLPPEEWFEGPYKDSLIKYNDRISEFHNRTRNAVETFAFPRPKPGTAAFDSLFNYITSRTFTEGGSKFFDRSALYHVMGEKQFKFDWADVRVGANYRLYLPNSRGNIFDEITDTNIVFDGDGNEVSRTYEYRRIQNSEVGAYLGVERKFFDNRLKVSLTGRIDKNQNFDMLFSPAVALVYEVDEKNTVRLSFGKAIRNPTLQDQYLRYDVGRAILLGNLNGFDSLVTLESFDDYRNNSADRSRLVYFDLDPIKPEEVYTLELGYRASLFKKVFVDLNLYNNWYSNFIGYQFGLSFDFANSTDPFFLPNTFQAYRVATNAADRVTTTGASIGINYYITDKLTLNGNYSYNAIDLRNSDNPIIPAYNTPLNKFNIGVIGRGYKLLESKKHFLGFAATYKWVEGFRFEGSPQFSGFIPSYGLLDAQISYQVEAWHSTFKLGSSNLLNNQVSQVYGGPRVGRLSYFSILFELY